MYDVLIIGGGITGCATAYELSKYELKAAVIESENDVACGSTKANTALIHAGYDPEYGTKMARLNVRGARKAGELCKKLSVPYKQIGSLVLALRDDDIATLKELYDNGVRNGVEGLALLSAAETLLLEPALSRDIKGSLLAPSAAVVSPWEYAVALAQTANRNGVRFFFDSGVTAIEKKGRTFTVTTKSGSYDCRYIINAAGLHADEVHAMAGGYGFTITPVKGQYFLLDKGSGSIVSRIIFQCPSKVGKGVVVSPTVHGNLIVGPSSKTAEAATDVSTSDENLEYVRSKAMLSVPEINFRDNIRNFAGLRAAADIDDFIIGKSPQVDGFINAAGIKSPGLSAAPAIAEELVEILRAEGLGLNEKADFCDERTVIRPKELDDTAKNRLIEQNPSYGRVICRCETVTEGEIVDALRSPLTPPSLDAIKRRCTAGMGRCQGGFCGPRVLEIIARERNIPPQDVLMDEAGSYILTGRTKGEAADNVL